jgi:hypothetical protein
MKEKAVYYYSSGYFSAAAEMNEKAGASEVD